MFRLPLSTVLFALSIASSAFAQTVIKILEFDKNTGIVDHGEQDGIRVGDVFEVNRYSDDYVIWVGRVEVIVVKPKAAGVKVLDRAANAVFLKDDVLEIRKREYDPMLDKLNHVASGDTSKESGNQKAKPAGKPIEPAASRLPLQFGLTTGFSLALNQPSSAMGQSLPSRIVGIENRVVRGSEIADTYSTSLALQGFCILPLTSRFTVLLNLAYVPLNVKSDVESALLDIGLMASASLIKIGSTLNYRLNERWQFGAGVGVFLPKLTISGSGRSLIVSDRHFGFASEVAYFIPVGSRIWLKSVLVYDIFLDDGPAIHSLAVQTGPIFSFGKP